MKNLIRDPELDRLVRALNADKPDAAVADGDLQSDVAADDDGSIGRAITPAWPATTIPVGSPLEHLLIDMAQRGASDLLILAGQPPVLRISGRLVKSESAVLEAENVQELLAPFLTKRLREHLDLEGAADFSLRLAGSAAADADRAWRFRINVHRQRGTLAAAIRALPTEVPTLAQLNLPSMLSDLVKPTRGLVLVCGPTGAGKSSTLAALVGEINHGDARHVVTIEDPIEYEHRNIRSVVEQVEVGRDAPSFAAALRASLRQDPDVILVGEMRDLETVSIALTAAESGHLILSTLHTSDAAQAIHRMVDVFPPMQQTQIKQQLALSLNAIVCQQLLPRADSKGRAVAIEVMLANHAIRNHIRNDKLQNLATEITLGKRHGMISFEDSLARLVQQGAITADEARIRSSRPDEFESVMRGGTRT